MKFKLSAYTIYEQGPRPRQEDSIFPAHGATTKDDRLFIVCDGMGGHSAGDVASSTVCSALSNYVLANVPDAEGAFTDDEFRSALASAYDALDTKDNGSPKKMGTTLTFLKLHSGGYTIAHIGDSRVYHIRPGHDAEATEILFQTQDHSLVNDLVRIGELTPEEAKTSKQRNVITRAMQPNMERRSRADIAHGNDIRPGDYFLLCSDGILEQMEDDNLKFIFSDKAGDIERKIEILIKVTADNHDNHSAVLVRIDDVELAADDVIIPYEKPMEVESEILEPHVAEHASEPEHHDLTDEEPHGGLVSSLKRYVVPLVAVLALALTALLVYNLLSKNDDAAQVSVAADTLTVEDDAMHMEHLRQDSLDRAQRAQDSIKSAEHERAIQEREAEAKKRAEEAERARIAEQQQQLAAAAAVEAKQQQVTTAKTAIEPTDIVEPSNEPAPVVDPVNASEQENAGNADTETERADADAETVITDADTAPTDTETMLADAETDATLIDSGKS